MKYIRSHKDFAKHINEVLNLNIPEEELERIDETFHNDITLSNSLMGQLFGWIFRKIGLKIKKGQMSALLEELANEFGKGQYSAVRHKSIAKKSEVYSMIINLKSLANNKSIDDEQFERRFSKELDDALEEYRELIEGKGNVRIEDAELMKVAKIFYSKLNKISSNPIDLKPELSAEDEASENVESEANIDNVKFESIEPNAMLLPMLEFAGESKLDVIATNLEKQLPNKNIIVGDNLIKIDEANLNFADVDRYFKALNMSIELINDSIIIENYDRLEMLLEYTSRGKYEFLYDLKDDIEVLLDTEVLKKGNRLRGVTVSKDSDYDEKGEAVYDAIFNRIQKNGIDLSKYSKHINSMNDKGFKKVYDNVIKYLKKFKYSKDDASGFKSNYSNLIRAMETAEGMLKSKIASVDKERSKRLEDEEEKEVTDRPVTDTKVPLTWDNKGRLSVNNKQFSKLGEADTKIKFLASDGTIKNGRINPNQPEEIDEEIGMINIFTEKGTTVAIDGAKIRELGKIETPQGILNRGHKEARERRKVEQSDWEQSVEELSWLLDKDIEYNKDGDIKAVHVLNKEEQLKDKGMPGGLKVKTPDIKDVDGKVTKKGHIYFLRDIKSKIVSQEGKPVDAENLSGNRDYVKSMLNTLFPNDKEYERELILNERDKKDLLNDIKHKAKNNDTLINPLQVMKIFNKAHHKYTVEDYASIPDGKQGSTLQGKGKGVNKKQHFKQMPDGSGRQIVLFKQWNEGVIDLLENYGDSIPDTLKKFIITVLNDNTIFGKGGAQAKLLQEYFNIKVDMEDVLSSSKGRGTTGKQQTTKSDIYADTKDTTGVFHESKSGMLQMKKENFNKVPFIMKGEIENVGETALVCYYMGTLNDNILFKYKENNIDFLNNYKREEQYIKDQEFSGNTGEEVKYGVMRTPKGANKDLKVGDILPIWSSDVNLEENVTMSNFKVKNVYYLQGESDGGVMRLDTKRPSSLYNDAQQEDIKQVWQKFSK